MNSIKFIKSSKPAAAQAEDSSKEEPIPEAIAVCDGEGIKIWDASKLTESPVVTKLIGKSSKLKAYPHTKGTFSVLQK